MPQPEESLREIFVQPGESHLVSEPTILRTVLGSCVGVTFYSPRLGVGALCHAMLPICPAKGMDRLGLAGRRYVDFAIRDLASYFDQLGAKRGEIIIKIFGGGDVLRVTNPGARPTVGQLNCETAIKVLRDEGFAVAASSLRGTCGLNIRFNTESGDVLLKRISITGAPCPVEHI
jgi:chemotaxis protein CheD